MIELKHVSKTYDSGANGGVDALKDVSLTIEDGDIYGIIGMSGAGKSTLVRCINLLERPTKGEIIVDGQRLDTMTPAQLRAARRNITMIFQHFNLLMQRTCLRNVCFPMEISGVKRADAEKRGRELLELVDRCNRPEWYAAIPKDLPVWLYAGDEDAVGNNGKGVTEVYEGLKAQGLKDVTITLYHGARHEVHNEALKEELFRDIIDYLDSHMPKAE